MKHIWKLKGCFYQTGEKCDEIAKGHSSKITETARWEPPWKAVYSEHSIAIHSISKAGYVTAVLAIVRTELRAREVSSFMWFLKKDLLRFHLILFFFDSSKLFFFMCLVRSIKANLCPIMINFYAWDFNVCRSEEVDKFLLTLTV